MCFIPFQYAFTSFFQSTHMTTFGLQQKKQNHGDLVQDQTARVGGQLAPAPRLHDCSSIFCQVPACLFLLSDTPLTSPSIRRCLSVTMTLELKIRISKEKNHKSFFDKNTQMNYQNKCGTLCSLPLYRWFSRQWHPVGAVHPPTFLCTHPTPW